MELIKMAGKMLFWITLALIAAAVVMGENHERFARSEDCDGSATFTIDNLIDMVKKIERSTPNWNFETTTNALREEGYPTKFFDLLCGQDGQKNIPGLTTKEFEQFQKMIKHPDPQDNGPESGVVLTREGLTIAFGHVLTGICAGIRRDFRFERTAARNVEFSLPDWFPVYDYVGPRQWVADTGSYLFWEPLDNLHAATLAGDLGQTCFLTDCELGTRGEWDDKGCPIQYNLTGTSNEATLAEILGDIHGFILGIIVPQINPIKLSDFLSGFYMPGSGLGRNGKFKAVHSIGLFKEVVSVHRLFKETDAFNEAYTKLSFWSRSSESTIQATVDRFFGLMEISTCSNVPATHRMPYFIELVAELERQSKNSLSTMVKDLCAMDLHPGNLKPNKKDQGFEWYIASEIMSGTLHGSTLQEFGVLQDNLDKTVKIPYVIRGIYNGLLFNSPSTKHIIYQMALHYRRHQFGIGDEGSWDNSCPKRYTAPSLLYPTRAAFLGLTDGMVLALTVTKYTQDNPSAKLSTLLSEYYSTSGLRGQADIKSANRFPNVDALLRSLDSGRGKRQATGGNQECYEAIRESLEEDCNEITNIDGLDSSLKSEDCGSASLQLCNTITETIKSNLQETTQCLFGDITNLKPSGASTKTGGSFGAGVTASQKIMERHMTRAEKYRSCFVQVGKATGIQPALIAALASRESHVYDIGSSWLLNPDGTSAASGNEGYGMMQCDPSSGVDCKKYGPDSCEHVQQVVEEILLKFIKQVRQKHSSWTDEQQIQGGVAAYNFGLGNVQTWAQLDLGSANNDFSNDVIARAQYLICKKNWAYCGETCAETTGSLPSYSTLRAKYPTVSAMLDDKLKTTLGDGAGDALRVAWMMNNIPGHELQHSVPGSKTSPNGKVYYEESRKMRLYLDDRYGFGQKATSMASFQDKPGILFVEQDGSNHGVIGLWDGRKVDGFNDFTNSGSTRYLWPTPGERDCKMLAKEGDCEFYKKCLEERLGCGEEGYPLGYGYKFCNIYSQYYDDFTEKGRKWVDDVRVCLMDKLVPILANPGLTCPKLAEIAFMSHVPCYDDNGFCEVMADAQNWDGLWNVFTEDLSPFFGPYKELSKQQIFSMLGRCFLLDEATDWLLGLIPDWAVEIQSIEESEPMTGDCIDFATNGNCRFYECFEQRFECKKVNGFSYLLQFELPSCLEFKRKAPGFSSGGRTWQTNFQKCMMRKLLPLYQSPSIDCSSMGYVIKQFRTSCLADRSFCDIIEDPANQFFIDRATQSYGFPQLEQRRPFTLPLSGSPELTGSLYYQELDSFKRDIGRAWTGCRGDSAIYTTIYSKATNMNMNIQNEVRPTSETTTESQGTKERCCEDLDLGCFDNRPPFSRLSLPKCYTDEDVAYLLYTNSNKDKHARIKRQSPVPSAFDASKRTIFVCHGYLSNSEDFEPMKDALLQKDDLNVVLIDWPYSLYYPKSATNTRSVGKLTALIMQKLVTQKGASYSNMWCIGHSLGAHVCGHAGRNTPSKIGQITGLDPAGPWFEREDDITIGLNRDNAQFVQAIHTDPVGRLWGYGTLRPLGHVDFYTNGLEREPGCWFKKKRRKKRVACSHGRPNDYYKISINNPCFVATQKCTDVNNMPGSCKRSSRPVSMGYGIDINAPEGIYYIETQKTPPYCIK